jgi:allantoinase
MTLPSTRIFRSRRVVLPSGIFAKSVHVSNGRITRVAEFDDVPEGAPIVDFGDSALLPGFVDTHVHVNEPGRTEWEGFETATLAASAGGITTIVDMPLNSIPPATTPKGLDTKAALTEGRIHVDVGLWGGATPSNTTGDPNGLADILREGARGFKCFLVPSGVEEFPFVEERDVEAGLLQLRDTDVRLMVHAELPGPIDAATAEIERALPPLDKRSYATYLRSRPKTAEDRAAELLFDLAKRTGAAVHIVHLSSAGALETLARARDENVRLTAETAPHYLHFAAEDVPDGATWFKCAPPIRERANRELLWEALRQGLVEMVVSDHSPCIPQLKRTEEGDFMGAWGGIAGLQFGCAAVWTEAKKRGFGLGDLVRWSSAKPAAHAGLQASKGEIAVGRDADFVVFDSEATFTVETKNIRHKNKLTPYDGETLTGVVRSTWLRGEQVFDGTLGPESIGNPTSTRPTGRWLKWEG